MEELESIIQRIWNAIHKEMCEIIIEYNKKRWDLCMSHKGRRLDKQLLQKISSQKKKLKLILSNNRINGIRISYNDKFVMKLKNKEIREKKKKLKEQIKVVNKCK